MAYDKQNWDDIADRLNKSETQYEQAVSYTDKAIAAIAETAAGGGGFGPNWVAAFNAPASVKDSVRASGGLVADGVADDVEINTLLAAHGKVNLSQGDFRLAGTIEPPQRRWLQGSGPSTNLVGASGLSGQFINVTKDHVWLSDFALSGGSESSNTHHINVAVVGTTGFWTGADACFNAQNIISRNSKGNGLRMTGSENRDSKVSKIHVWNATSDGFYFDTPDGNATQLVAGTCGGYGVYANTSNWRISHSKAWYSDKDGFFLSGARNLYTDLEGQDNAWAGIRLNANFSEINGATCDSNSYEGTANVNLYAGLEVGTTRGGGASGGYDLIVTNVQSWDKNEGKRGYNQRSGVRFRAGIRGLVANSIVTGDTAGTHRNVTAGVEWVNPSDATNSANYVGLILSNRIRGVG